MGNYQRLLSGEFPPPKREYAWEATQLFPDGRQIAHDEFDHRPTEIVEATILNNEEILQEGEQ